MALSRLVLRRSRALDVLSGADSRGFVKLMNKGRIAGVNVEGHIQLELFVEANVRWTEVSISEMIIIVFPRSILGVLVSIPW